MSRISKHPAVRFAAFGVEERERLAKHEVAPYETADSNKCDQSEHRHEHVRSFGGLGVLLSIARRAAVAAALVIISPPALAMKVAVVQGVLPTSLTSVDLTDAVFSSDVEAAICSISTADANNTVAAHGVWSIGAAANDGSASQFTSGVAATDAAGTSTTGSQFFTDHIYTIGNGSSSTGEGVLSFLTNGVRITVDDTNGALLINCLILGGSDIEAEIGLGQYPGSASNNDVTIAHGLSGTPDLALIVAATTTTVVGNARAGVGFWGRTAPGETGYSWQSNTTAATGDTIATASSTVAIPAQTGNVSADVQSADGTNFVVRGTNSATDYVRVLFLRGVSSQIEARVGNFLSETATGTDDQIAGFTANIQAGLLIGTQLASVGNSTGVPSSVLSLGMFANNGGTIQQGATLISDQDGADPTVVKGVTSNTAAQVLMTAAGVIDYVAAATVMDTEVTFDTTNADAEENQYLYLAFGAAAAASPAFDSGPTVTAVDDNTFRVTYDANADADNIYCGAWLKDATTPTEAEIEAGTNAHGTGTEATTGASDTLDFDVTDNPPHPVYDVYCVLEAA